MIVIIDADHLKKYKTKSVNNKDNYEHRVVMEKYLGRPLLSTEVVHHKNRNRQDNRIENLQLCSSHAEHRKIHAEEDCIAAGYDPNYYKWCSYHSQYELKQTFGKHKSRCSLGTKEFKKHKEYKSLFTWKSKMNQQFRRAQKKGICSPLKEGSCP
jgi:hypothetical protein